MNAPPDNSGGEEGTRITIVIGRDVALFAIVALCLGLALIWRKRNGPGPKMSPKAQRKSKSST